MNGLPQLRPRFGCLIVSPFLAENSLRLLAQSKRRTETIPAVR